MKTSIRAVLIGSVTGPVWNGFISTKEISQNLPYRRRGQFVLALQHACKDGDFMSCKLDPDTVIEVTLTKLDGRKVVKVTKVFGIGEFASAAPFICEGETV